MPTFRGLAGTQYRPTLSPPDFIPREEGDRSIDPTSIGADGTQTNQVPLAPTSETRVAIANRAFATFRPGPSYANIDPQKGGAPGAPGGDPSRPTTSESFITSQGPDGTTIAGAAPNSPLKISYGYADWWGHTPTVLPMHQVITKFANPNRPQVNPTPFNSEGPSQNTKYTSPAPWAAGVYIG